MVLGQPGFQVGGVAFLQMAEEEMGLRRLDRQPQDAIQGVAKSLGFCE